MTATTAGYILFTIGVDEAAEGVFASWDEAYGLAVELWGCEVEFSAQTWDSTDNDVDASWYADLTADVAFCIRRRRA